MYFRLFAWSLALGVFAGTVAGAAHAQAPSRAADGAPRTVKVAAVQCSSDLGAVDANRVKLSALVEEAAANGAKIIVLPEAAVTGYLSQDLKTNWRLRGWPIEKTYQGKDPLPFAEAVPGPSTDHFAALAKKLGVYITVPLVEVDRGRAANGDGAARAAPVGGRPRLFNTVCLVAPEGKLVAHYRKLTP